MSPSQRRSRRQRYRTVALAAALLVALGAVGFGSWWTLSGGHWFVVRTPSMGRSAPVGTLLWVEPTPAHDLRVGEFITFRPPGLDATYSHRIYSIAADGSIHTKGDANAGPDSWTITGRDVVGRVVARWWGTGWLVRAIPLLVGGALLLYALLRWATPRDKRLAAGLIGLSFLLSLSLYVYRPLVGADKIAVLPTDPGIEATYISTGLLPLRLHAQGGTSTDLAPGQQGTVHSTRHVTGGRLAVGLVPVIRWWWWLVIAVPWFAPALWTTLSRRRGPPTVAPAPA